MILRLSRPRSMTAHLRQYPDFHQSAVDLSAKRVPLGGGRTSNAGTRPGSALVISDEIVPGDHSGGATTSHTIVVPAALPARAYVLRAESVLFRAWRDL